MDLFLDRIDATGAPLSIPDPQTALRDGEALHRGFRPYIPGDYAAYLDSMAAEGARITQLVDEDEVRALAVWRTYLTTYAARRMEIDDLVTAETHRSKGYGATLLQALESRARALSCKAVLLTSATKRVEAHRFYLRERYTICAFQFLKVMG